MLVLHSNDFIMAVKKVVKNEHEANFTISEDSDEGVNEDANGHGDLKLRYLFDPLEIHQMEVQIVKNLKPLVNYYELLAMIQAVTNHLFKWWHLGLMDFIEAVQTFHP